VKNSSETDIDCGGSCNKCVAGKKCLVGGDCQSGVCDSAIFRCLAPDCSDGVMNGDETDVDCGGSCTAKCANQLGCSQDSDCSSGFCHPSSECTASSCSDGVMNADETDVDCGGPDCGPCADASQCSSSSDCESKVCDTAAATPTCSAATCSDGVMNADETDVDCGGPDCGPCAAILQLNTPPTLDYTTCTHPISCL